MGGGQFTSDQQDAVLIMKLVPGGGPYLINAVTPWRGVRTKRYTYVNLLGHGLRREAGCWLTVDDVDLERKLLVAAQRAVQTA